MEPDFRTAKHSASEPGDIPDPDAYSTRIVWPSACVNAGDNVMLAAWPQRSHESPPTSSWLRDGIRLAAGDAQPPGRPAAWPDAGAMSRPRYGQATALLPDGTVMVAGGTHCAGSANQTACEGNGSVELYDPLSNTWSASDGPGFEPFRLLTLADGRILATTGQDLAIFDVAGRQWIEPSASEPIPEGSTRDWVPLKDGRVLQLTETYSQAHGEELVIALYDPATDRWSEISSPPQPLRSPIDDVILPDGRWLVIAGGSAMLWDPSDDAWAETGPLPPSGTHGPLAFRPLSDGSVLLLQHFYTLWVVPSPPEQVVGRFDPRSGSWTSAASPFDSPYHALVRVTPLADGRVLAFDPNYSGTAPVGALIYTPATDSWQHVAAPRAVYDVDDAIALSDGRVMLLGPGFGGVEASEIYDPAADAWGEPAVFAGRLRGFSATLLTDGSVLVAGGDSSRGTLATAERFAPSATVAGAQPAVLSLPRAGTGALRSPSVLPAARHAAESLLTAATAQLLAALKPWLR